MKRQERAGQAAAKSLNGRFMTTPSKTLRGSCQCKRITFEADIDWSQGTGKCNCTSCFKRRWWSVRVEPKSFRVLAGDSERTEKGFCKHCGIVPYAHVAKSEWNPNEYVSVNVAALDGLNPQELMEVPIKYMDGLNDDWWHVPKYTGHL